MTSTAIPRRPLADLRPWDGNPRSISAARLKDLMAALAAEPEMMDARPLIATPDGEVVAGNMRLEAARALGWEDAPTYTIDLDERRKREWALRDNASYGEWVPEDLAAVLGEARELADGDLSLSGFTPADVDRILGVQEPEPEDPPDLDLLPAVPDEPVTRRGDLIRLGDHRLLCGDATDPQDVAKLLDDRRVDAVIMDPPYAIYGSSTGLAAEVADDKMVRSFFREILQAAARSVKPFGQVYVCCDWRSWASWWEVAKGTGLAPKNMIVWDKGGGGLGNNYANAHELILYATAIPKRTKMTVDNAGQRAVMDPNIWRIPRVPSGDERIHNAQKPVELVARAVRNSTDAGERVLDLFAGSGTILLAAEAEGRQALAMDVDPAWVDAAVLRWERVTGGKAKRPRRRS